MVTIVDPHIKRDPEWRLFKEAEEKGLYVKNKDGADFDGWVQAAGPGVSMSLGQAGTAAGLSCRTPLLCQVNAQHQLGALCMHAAPRVPRLAARLLVPMQLHMLPHPHRRSSPGTPHPHPHPPPLQLVLAWLFILPGHAEPHRAGMVEPAVLNKGKRGRGWFLSRGQGGRLA